MKQGKNKEKIRILLVDDDEDDYVMTRDILSDLTEMDIDLEWVASFEKACEKMTNPRYDLFFLDYYLGDYTGLDLLRQAVKNGCSAPIILLTGQEDYDIDVEAMQSGAADYLIKSEIDASSLERAIRYALERKRSEVEKINVAQNYDTVTGLPNLLLFKEHLDDLLSSVSGCPCKNIALIILDLDKFKRVNDSFGFRMGDELLKRVAEKLSAILPKNEQTSSASRQSGLFLEMAARLGGDEFALLLCGEANNENVAFVADTILKSMAEQTLVAGQVMHVTASLGISIFPRDGSNADLLFNHADSALMRAKKSGRNNYQVYQGSMNPEHSRRLVLENSLHGALDRQEFTLYFQPQMELDTKKIVGLEALVRWHHPQFGLVSPAEFIPMAEGCGLIVAIGEWVVNEACKQLKRWLTKGFGHLRMSINLSNHQFNHHNFQSDIYQAIKEYQLPTGSIELEITESLAMNNETMTIALLQELKGLGIRLAMDDFGTGYSSFFYLKRFPLDTLKIDRSFLKEVPSSNEDMAIVKAIVAMAHSLNLTVVAEGVEHKEQLVFLQGLDCDLIQGDLVSSAKPAEDIEELLLREKRGFAII